MTENEALEVGKSLYENITLKGNNIIPVAKYIEFVRTAIKALEEIQQHRAIGTIEELKTLKEKSIVKKPRFYAHNYYCTECGNLVGNNEFEWQRFLYCDNCGQKLDWQ